MSKYLIKTILSPVLLILILFTALFSASAEETSNQFSQSSKAISYYKKFSTSDEIPILPGEANTIPTMKPAYYNAMNNQDGNDNQSNDNNKESDNSINTPDNISDNTQSFNDKKDATPEIGATSQISTADTLFPTPDAATPDAATTGGVVNTSDTSISIFVLLGLIASSCLLIGIHKKEITE